MPWIFKNNYMNRLPVSEETKHTKTKSKTVKVLKVHGVRISLKGNWF